MLVPKLDCSIARPRSFFEQLDLVTQVVDVSHQHRSSEVGGMKGAGNPAGFRKACDSAPCTHDVDRRLACWRKSRA